MTIPNDAIIEFSDGHVNTHNYSINKICSIEKYIDTLSDDEKLILIDGFPACMLLMKNPYEEFQLKAIEKSLFVIKYIKNSTEKVQLTVIKKNVAFYEDIENTHENTTIEAKCINDFL